jgi:hypothetical protein
MFNYYRKDDRTDRERYLEEELERTRYEEEKRQERADREREERRRELQEQWRYEERQADSWPEAFQKQAMLCWREHNQYPDDLNDHFFEYSAQANEKALEIWKEVSISKQGELDMLQKQIEAVRDAIRNEVADKLIASSEHKEYRGVAEAIRDDALANYLDW